MRHVPIIALVSLSWATLADAQTALPDSAASVRVLDVLDPCRARAPADEILICGRRNTDRYRLPRFGEGRAAPGAGNVRGEVPRASADQGSSGECGIFQGQRRCSEAEMAEFGYGRGRDPVTLVGNIITMLADPDADIGTPSPLPE